MAGSPPQRASADVICGGGATRRSHRRRASARQRSWGVLAARSLIRPRRAHLVARNRTRNEYLASPRRTPRARTQTPSKRGRDHDGRRPEMGVLRGRRDRLGRLRSARRGPRCDRACRPRPRRVSCRSTDAPARCRRLRCGLDPAAPPLSTPARPCGGSSTPRSAGAVDANKGRRRTSTGRAVRRSRSRPMFGRCALRREEEDEDGIRPQSVLRSRRVRLLLRRERAATGG